MIDDSKLVASLLEEGLTDQPSIDAVRAKTRGGRSLYEALIRAKVVDEVKVVGVAARVLGVPMGHMPGTIPNEVLRLVPGSLAYRNRAIPLAKSGEATLVLGMINPTDELGRDEVAMHAGVEVEVVLIGPATLEAALQRYYPKTSASDSLEAFDNFDLSSFGEELPGDDWSDYFDDSEASVEDSAVLSRDMRDRPSTDVLAEELGDEAERLAAEDLPEIEIIEELGRPIRDKPIAPYASLDKWEVDAAIGGSAIVSASDAGSLFESSTPNEVEQEDAGATNQLSKEVDTDTLTDQARRTSVGVGVEEMHRSAGAARQRRKKNPAPSSSTQVGNPMTLAAAQSDATDDAPDYAELGRAILKAKLNEDSVADTSVTEMKPVTKKKAVVALFEDDDEEIPQLRVQTTHAHGTATPAPEEGTISFPEELDPNALAAALAALLVGKGILTLDEIVSLARELTVDKRSS